MEFLPGKVSADAKTERFFTVIIGFTLGYFEETVDVNQIYYIMRFPKFIIDSYKRKFVLANFLALEQRDNLLVFNLKALHSEGLQQLILRVFLE